MSLRSHVYPMQPPFAKSIRDLVNRWRLQQAKALLEPTLTDSIFDPPRGKTR